MKQWLECLCGNYVLSYKNCQSTVPENTVPWLFFNYRFLCGSLLSSVSDEPSHNHKFHKRPYASPSPGLPDRNDNYVWYIHPRLRHLLDDGASFFLCSLDYFFCNFNTSSIGNPENLEISSVENLGFSNIHCAVSKACSWRLLGAVQESVPKYTTTVTTGISRSLL